MSKLKQMGKKSKEERREAFSGNIYPVWIVAPEVEGEGDKATFAEMIENFVRPMKGTSPQI